MATPMPALELQRKRSAEPTDHVITSVGLLIIKIGSAASGDERLCRLVDARAERDVRTSLSSLARNLEPGRKIPDAIQILVRDSAALVGRAFGPRVIAPRPRKDRFVFADVHVGLGAATGDASVEIFEFAVDPKCF